MKRLLSLILVMGLLMGVPMTFAEESYTVNTSLETASDAKRTNIAIAASRLDGYVIAQGEDFSFNSVIGPCTAAYGFERAMNGRGSSVTGGGVAQAATTLYMALSAAGADVTYTQLRTFGSSFADDYAESGDRAIMVDPAAGLDFCFTNNDGDLMIEMWMSERKLYCSVAKREAKTSAPQAWSFAPASEMYAADVEASFALNGSEELINNVELAAASICDTTLGEGDLFSFNTLVGPREGKYGYKKALNGRGVQVVGGGVAQVASVIWLAVKQLDCIAVVEKTTYGSRYNQHYVESSNDAILTDYKGKTDFSFRYTGSGSMTITTYVSNGMLICSISLE